MNGKILHQAIMLITCVFIVMHYYNYFFILKINLKTCKVLFYKMSLPTTYNQLFHWKRWVHRCIALLFHSTRWVHRCIGIGGRWNLTFAIFEGDWTLSKWTKENYINFGMYWGVSIRWMEELLIDLLCRIDYEARGNVILGIKIHKKHKLPLILETWPHEK